MNRKSTFVAVFMIMAIAFILLPLLPGCGGGGFSSGDYDSTGTVKVEVSYPQDQKDKSSEYISYYLIDILGDMPSTPIISTPSPSPTETMVPLVSDPKSSPTYSDSNPIIPTTRVDYPNNSVSIQNVPVGEHVLYIHGYDQNGNLVSYFSMWITVTAGSNPAIEATMTPGSSSPTPSPTPSASPSPTPTPVAYLSVSNGLEYDRYIPASSTTYQEKRVAFAASEDITGITPKTVTYPGGTATNLIDLTPNTATVGQYYVGASVVPVATNFEDPLTDPAKNMKAGMYFTGGSIAGDWIFNYGSLTKTLVNAYTSYLPVVTAPAPASGGSLTPAGGYNTAFNISWNPLGASGYRYFVQVYNRPTGSGGWDQMWTSGSLVGLDFSDPASVANFYQNETTTSFIVTVPAGVLQQASSTDSETYIIITAFKDSELIDDATGAFRSFMMNRSSLEYWVRIGI